MTRPKYDFPKKFETAFCPGGEKFSGGKNFRLDTVHHLGWREPWETFEKEPQELSDGEVASRDAEAWRHSAVDLSVEKTAVNGIMYDSPWSTAAHRISP